MYASVLWELGVYAIFLKIMSGIAMSPTLKSRELYERAEAAFKQANPCLLCPRACGVNRLSGERGYCGAGPLPRVAGTMPHGGEEPVLTGTGGAGTIFFSECNLHCVYCQNHQISQGGLGSEISTEELAREFLGLQAAGCVNIEPVSPSHYLPWFLEALAHSVEQGLNLPVVYNTNAYESKDTLEILDGVVDVYLPDLKYADEAKALLYSHAKEYVQMARAAVIRMRRQVGRVTLDHNGNAVKGLIVRHLILPDDVSGTRDTLYWLADNLPPSTSLSLMAQYSPLHNACAYPGLNRVISESEYEAAVSLAWELGFTNVFIQEPAAQVMGIPDFTEATPFCWDGP